MPAPLIGYTSLVSGGLQVKLRLLALSLLCAALATGVARATIVIPPTFEQLVSNAKLIFAGEAIDLQSSWEPRPDGGRAIVTQVTLRVEDVWKGSVGAVTQLQFLGGTIDGLTLAVSDMPSFRLGQRDVLFVGDTVRVMSPLVGFMHGRVRIERELATGIDRVRTFDGRSLGSTADLGGLRPPSFEPITPMRLADFKAAVLGRLALGRAR